MAQSRSHAMAAFAFVVVFLLSGAPGARSQQPYGSQVADCPNKHNDTGLLGYFCSSGGGGGGAPSSSSSSCQTYLTFHATPRYPDLAAIASLLGADASSLAAANSAALPTAALAPGAKVLVPATCSCTGAAYYQRNATYVAVAGDTLLVIANDTFQGLSTCQAVQEQALGDAPARSLLAGQRVTVPLRCACPSAAQAAAGLRYLVTYLVDEFDEVGAIAARFGVDAGNISAANEMAITDTIYPFTTLLIPVKSKPDVSQLRSPPPPPPPPPAAPAPTTNRKNHTGVYVGIGAAAVAVLAVVTAVVAALAVRARRQRRRATAAVAAAGGKGGKGNDKASPAFTGGEVSVSISEAFSGLSDIKSSLKVFTYAELAAATDGFSPDRRVGGSVYRAVFNGDAAAVEVVDRDVSAEVEIMRKINHLNLVRLIGLCHHRGRWYLVSEYAEHGTLRDRLLAGGGAPPLSWSQRVQVALDVAEGLRYLHGYTRPPYVHMDVSSDSVLLAGGADLRGKLRNFGGARVIRGGGGEAFTMTSNIAGTRGYTAPEYLEHGVVSPKADVYSLGVVLLELVTGKGVDELEADGAGDPFAGMNALAGDLDGGSEDDAAVTRRMEEFLDPAMAATGSSCPREAVAMMVKLIERCVRRDAAARPGMGEVAQHLLMLHGVSGDGWHSSLEHYRSSGGDGGEQP
ncbi:hypothetical protein OsJ_34255 [Oryza sativa Japonica Group]|uniref:Protein kinase domain-containing protein n=1 Tax=Oryza sativa subsp. japonica TaxID=39947 RepID=A3CCC1_ORYSJ|nr:hypothetical protein OsJ_34255 [Oryza sativa Japonica Group]